jgi:hypothetical protein
MWLEKGCGVSHKLDHWSSLQRLRKGITLRVDQDGIKAYLSAITFHLLNKLAIYHTQLMKLSKIALNTMTFNVMTFCLLVLA